MGIEEINALELDDYRETLSHRLWNRFDPRPEEMPEFSEAELESEFTAYKSELIAQENERLRRKDLEDRFKGLTDMRQAFHSLHSEPNPELWLKNLLFSDPANAESKMAELESKDIELQTSPEKIWADYYEARNAEYAKRGVTRDAIMEAQWEKDMEGRPEKADALQLIRLEVKELIPKPE